MVTLCTVLLVNGATDDRSRDKWDQTNGQLQNFEIQA